MAGIIKLVIKVSLTIDHPVRAVEELSSNLIEEISDDAVPPKNPPPVRVRVTAAVFTASLLLSPVTAGVGAVIMYLFLLVGLEPPPFWTITSYVPAFCKTGTIASEIVVSSTTLKEGRVIVTEPDFNSTELTLFIPIPPKKFWPLITKVDSDELAPDEGVTLSTTGR